MDAKRDPSGFERLCNERNALRPFVGGVTVGRDFTPVDDVLLIQRLDSTLRHNYSLQELLLRFVEIDLPDAWIVAGCIAQTVWNLSAGQPAERGIKDVDIIYFDPCDLSAETETSHERRLSSLAA